MAAGGHFGFWLLTNSAAIFARVMGAKFFLNTSKSSNQVSNLTMLSVVTGPPDCTQLLFLYFTDVFMHQPASMFKHSSTAIYICIQTYVFKPCLGINTALFVIT